MGLPMIGESLRHGTLRAETTHALRDGTRPLRHPIQTSEERA
jgi:hypothetical protein